MMDNYKIIKHYHENSERNIIFDYIISLGFDDALFFHENINMGIHLQQNPDELTDLVMFLVSKFDKKPIKYLEVGSAAGGTCFVFNKYLNIEHNAIIDNNMHPKAPHRQEVLKTINHTEFVGNSLDKDAIEFAKNKGEYDLMFIDAGHQYDEIKNDIINYTPFLNKSGIVIFHDTSAVSDVRKAVDELITNTWKLLFESNVQFGIQAYTHEN